MGNILPFPPVPREMCAITCDCGCQTLILVVDVNNQPDFIYCPDCQLRVPGVGWVWVAEPVQGPGDSAA